MTPNDFITRYLAIKSAGWEPNTIRRVSCTLNNYLRVVPDFEPHHYAEWVKKLRSSGSEPSSIAMQRTTMSAFYRFGMAQGWFASNPDAMIPSVRVPQARKGRFITDQKYRQMLASAEDTRYWWLIMLAYNTGLAMVDCCLLEWDFVDLEVPSLSGPRHKTGTVYEVVFHPASELYRELVYLKARRLRRCRWVAPELEDGYRRHSIDRGLRRHLLGYQFHDFRRTLHTKLVMSGVNPHIAGRIVGTRDINVFHGYVLHDTQAIADGVKKALQWEPKPLEHANEHQNPVA